MLDRKRVVLKGGGPVRNRRVPGITGVREEAQVGEAVRLYHPDRLLPAGLALLHEEEGVERDEGKETEIERHEGEEDV